MDMKKVYKFNYLYKLILISDPRYYYFGIRSTDIQPEFDRYKGSGRAIEKLKKQGLDFYKEIVENFETREEVEVAEEKAVGTLWKVDPYCLNRSKGGQKGGKFLKKQKRKFRKPIGDESTVRSIEIGFKNKNRIQSGLV